MEKEDGASISYYGTFTDKATIQGKYTVDSSGGGFNIWIADGSAPGLSSYAFQSRMPKRRKRLAPVEDTWLGYYYYEGLKVELNMRMTFSFNGDITGHGKDVLGEYDIVGKHENYNAVSFIITMQKVYSGKPSWVVYYDGGFVGATVIEGKYFTTSHSGNFLIYKEGTDAITIQNTNLPFDDVIMRWDGYYVQYENIKFGMQMYLKLSPDGTVTGHGKDSLGPFSINGTHENYKDIKFIKQMEIEDGWSINYTGILCANGRQIEGNYIVPGDVGPFNLFLC